MLLISKSKLQIRYTLLQYFQTILISILLNLKLELCYKVLITRVENLKNLIFIEITTAFWFFEQQNFLMMHYYLNLFFKIVIVKIYFCQNYNLSNNSEF